jgi:hypothetical protein
LDFFETLFKCIDVASYYSRSYAVLTVLMHPFPVHSERLKPRRERKDWDEFQEESKERRGEERRGEEGRGEGRSDTILGRAVEILL